MNKVTEQESEHLTQFRELTKDLGDQEIPTDELDYFSLCMGFLIAKGVEPGRAYDLSVFARYDLEIA